MICYENIAMFRVFNGVRFANHGVGFGGGREVLTSEAGSSMQHHILVLVLGMYTAMESRMAYRL